MASVTVWRSRQASLSTAPGNAQSPLRLTAHSAAPPKQFTRSRQDQRSCVPGKATALDLMLAEGDGDPRWRRQAELGLSPFEISHTRPPGPSSTRSAKETRPTFIPRRSGSTRTFIPDQSAASAVIKVRSAAIPIAKIGTRRQNDILLFQVIGQSSRLLARYRTPCASAQQRFGVPSVPLLVPADSKGIELAAWTLCQ